MSSEGNKDGQIEIDLSVPEDDKKAKKPAEKKPETAVETAATTTTPPVDEALAALKKQLDDEKAGRASDQARLRVAEDTARQASDTAVTSQTAARSANLTMVTNAIDSVKREQEILEANLANAMSASDFAGAAKIQTQIATAAAKLVQLDAGKEAMEAEAKLPIKRMEPTRDPVEVFASQLSARSADWVRAHPNCVTDQRLYDRMIGADKIARSDGLKANSDAYFEKVEEIMGFRSPAPVQEEEEALSDAAQPVKQRSSSPAAAPVTRSGTGNGQRPNTVTLTAAEREIASLNGMTDREYAIEKEKLKKEGRLN